MIQDFSGVKIGQKLWSIQLGACEALEISTTYIICKNKAGRKEGYWLNGCVLKPDLFPSLFWSNPNIQIPERPKRKVKKEYKVFIHIIQGLPDSVHLSHDSLICNTASKEPIIAKGILSYEIEE